MNKLIPRARYSRRDAREQRFRLLRRGYKENPDDVRQVETSWDRAAEGLIRHAKKSGVTLAELFQVASSGNK